MTTQSMRRPYAAPATLTLLSAGGTSADLAAHLGVSESAVSMYLTGRRPLPVTMRPALVSLVGDDAAGRVLDLVPRKDAVAV